MVLVTVLTQSKPVSSTAVRPVSAIVPKLMVTRPRLAHPIVTKSKSPIRRHITRIPSLKTSNSPSRVTSAQAPVGNPQYALKDKGVIDSRCSQHMTRNVSYLSDFEELNGGYVSFRGNPKGGKISGKGKIKKGVATAFAEYEANRGSGNVDDSHNSRSGRRTERAARECTYNDILKCQPLNFKGTEGVVGLT
nr:hypothetical protein [Tanacetum cinerariifolium]